MENKKDAYELTNMKIKCNSKINNDIIYMYDIYYKSNR